MRPILFAPLWPPGWALLSLGMARLIHLPWPMAIRYAAGWGAMQAGGVVIGAAWSGDWNSTAVATGNLIILLALWWWFRKDRRRATALLGAKSKALRDALVRKQRELARPRPVFRPAPGGAG